MVQYLFYDDDCGICRKFAEIIAPLQAGGNVRVEPYQALDQKFKQRYCLSDAAFEKGMYFLDADTGKVSHGALALNRFFLRFVPFRFLVWILYGIPVFLLAEVLLYHLVARNRAGLSRMLGLAACRKPDNSHTQ